MIVDNLKNIDKYKSLIPENVISYLKEILRLSVILSEMKDFKKYEPQNDKIKLQSGSYTIDEDNYINIDEYSPKPMELCRFEAHKKYIDIQIMLDGEEYIDITDIDTLEVSEHYNTGKDVMFFKPKDGFDRILLTPLKFVLIYPHEAHRPQVKTNCDKVKKAVVKVFIR